MYDYILPLTDALQSVADTRLTISYERKGDGSFDPAEIKVPIDTWRLLAVAFERFKEPQGEDEPFNWPDGRYNDGTIDQMTRAFAAIDERLDNMTGNDFIRRYKNGEFQETHIRVPTDIWWEIDQMAYQYLDDLSDM